jgi:hypothetical protein
MTTYLTYFQKPNSGALIFGPTLSPPYIKIVCIDTRWDDFGYNYRAKLNVVPGNGRDAFTCNLQVMPVVNNAPARRLDNWIGTLLLESQENYANAPQNSVGEIHFISLLATDADYRNLAGWTRSTEELYEILLLISDVVYTRHINAYRPELLNALINTPNFRFAMLRSGSAYQAFHKGRHRLISRNQEYLNDGRQSFSFKCTLKGFESSNHELNINYVDTLYYEDRVHCLIGINGSGKTRLLREFLLTLGRRADPSETEIFLDNHLSGAISEVQCNAPVFNRVLVFASDLQQSYPSYTRTDSFFEYMHFPLVRIGGGTSSASEKMARILVSITRDTDLLGNSHRRYDLLRDALRGYVDIGNIYIPITSDSTEIRKDIRLVEGAAWIRLGDIIRAGGEQKNLDLSSRLDEDRELTLFGENDEIIQLSSGQLVFFEFGLHFISYVEIGTLVILDEPETHLHPNLVCDFMTLLHKVLKLTKSVALIATHSPYVVREVPTHCVHTLTADEDGVIQIGGVYLKTLGASISSISQAVFGDPTIKKYHEEVATQLASTGRTLDQIIIEYQEILSPEMLIQIRYELEQGLRSQ